MPAPIRNHQITGFSLSIFFGLIAVWIGSFHHPVPYDPDSAHYIEQARSLIDGTGFQSRPNSLRELDRTLTPDRLFPPGYPLMAAFVASVSGISTEFSAVILSSAAVLAFPVIAYLLFYRALGAGPALTFAGLASLSPSIVHNAHYALSDALSVVFVLAAIGLFAQSAMTADRRRQIVLAGLAGFLAGFAYLIRNANISLILAFPFAAMASRWLWRDEWSRKELAPRLSAWMLGVGLVSIPWLVRNYRVFGSIQPYDMPASTVGVVTNTRAFVAAQIADLSGSRQLGEAVSWDRTYLLSLGLAVIVLLATAWLLRKKIRPDQGILLMLCLAQATLSALVVIASRSKYEWGETINERHVIATSPFILLALILLYTIVKASRRRKAVLAITALLTMLAGKSIAFAEVARQLAGRQPPDLYKSISDRVQGLASKTDGRCGFPDERLLVSNYAFYYRIYCDINARNTEEHAVVAESAVQKANAVANAVGTLPVRAAFHPARGFARTGYFPLPKPDLEVLVARGWKIEENSITALIMTKN